MRIHTAAAHMTGSQPPKVLPVSCSPCVSSRSRSTIRMLRRESETMHRLIQYGRHYAAVGAEHCVGVINSQTATLYLNQEEKKEIEAMHVAWLFSLLTVVQQLDQLEGLLQNQLFCISSFICLAGRAAQQPACYKLHENVEWIIIGAQTCCQVSPNPPWDVYPLVKRSAKLAVWVIVIKANGAKGWKYNGDIKLPVHL